MKKIDINGIWDFIVDLDPKYHTSPVYASPEWDRSRWEKIVVPGVWNLYRERYSIYEGVCWYAREFEYSPEIEDRRVILRFGGVNYRCDIFLNGEKAGEHEGGYTEFVVDVSHLIKKGKNLLAVRVDNRSLITKLPTVLGWFNYGGIHRDVTLEIYQDVYIADLSVKGRDDGLLSVKGKIASINRSSFDVEIICGDITKKIEGITEEINISLKIPGIKRWSPEKPSLYPVKISLISKGAVLDERVINIGFRSISIEGTDIFLNGKKIYLKGISYLYDSPVYGLVMEKEQYQRDILLMKELGVNIIRSHFPFPDEFLSECDRQGLMVWVEIPVYCITTDKEAKGTVFSDERYKKLALTMIEEMIIQSRNHPSVVIYGIGNECETKNLEAEGFFQALSEKAREMDDRLLAYASLYGDVGVVGNLVDVLGINEYWGWYDVIGAAKRGREINLDKLEEKLKELTGIYKKPLVISEFGADAIPGYISESGEFWSEDYYSEFIEKSFEVFKRYPLCGTFLFCFSDYKDPSKYINRYWDGMNYKGVVSYNRIPKKSFYTLKKIYKGIK